MLTVTVSIDVPDLERGARFYQDAFGFKKVADPYPGVAILKAGSATLTLLEKRAQTKPSPSTSDVRRYERHWTPVHVDFHVDDVKGALEKAVNAGATKEQFFESATHGSAAFCADPFGNGFCILQNSRK